LNRFTSGQRTRNILAASHLSKNRESERR
jgi:hypothetical protein